MWNNLKASIASVVRTNDNQEITGANLQDVLNTIVNSVGANATFAGIATPSTNPGTPDGPVFYIACEPGIYSNFNLTLVNGLYILENKTGSWVGTQIVAEYVQQQGQSTTVAMSQKAVTDALNLIYEAIDDIYSQDNLLNASTKYTTASNRKATSANSAVVGEAYNLTPTSKAYYSYYKIPVKPEQEYNINVVAASSEAYPVVFLDSNLIILEIPTIDKAVQDAIFLNSKKVIAPANAAWMIVHTYRSGGVGDLYKDSVVLIGKINEEFNRLEEDTYLYVDEKSFDSVENGSYIYSDGSKVTRTAYARIGYKSVVPGEIFRLKNILSYSKVNNKYLVNYAFYSDMPISIDNVIAIGPFTGGVYNDEIVVPQGANILAIPYSTSGYDFITIEKRITGEDIKEIENKILKNKSDIAKLENDVTNNKGIFTEENLPLGEKDNFFKYTINNVLRRDYTNNRLATYGNIIKVENSYTQLYLSLYQLGETVMKNIDVVLCIKKQDKVIHTTFTSGNFMSYRINDLIKDQILYNRQGSGQIDTSVVGKVLYVDDNWVQIYLYGSSSFSGVTFYTCNIRVIDNLLYNSESQTYPFDLWEDYCGLYYSEPNKDIKPMRYYKSRAEKLGSNLLGKSAIAYGDSLFHFMDYLVVDWGLSIYSFSGGGCRMGYVSAPGQSSIEKWLCNDSAIQSFIANKPEHIDFIINMDGNNENYRTYGMPSASDVEFVYNNKRWYDKENLQSDPFDNLTDEEKMRFLGSTCYIVSAYSLAQLYPNIQLVVVEPYFNVGQPGNFIDGKWASIAGFANDLLKDHTYIDEKKNFLRQLAEKSSAIYIPDYVDVGLLNAPTHIEDGTHPDNVGSRSKAWSIAKAINFPSDIDNAIY